MSAGGHLVSRVGIEPTTNGLKGHCSTIELAALVLGFSGPFALTGAGKAADCKRRKARGQAVES